MTAQATIAAVLQRRSEVKAQWSKELAAGSASGKGRVSAEKLDRQAGQFLDVFSKAAQSARLADVNAAEWADTRAFPEELSRQRVLAGFVRRNSDLHLFSQASDIRCAKGGVGRQSEYASLLEWQRTGCSSLR